MKKLLPMTLVLLLGLSAALFAQELTLDPLKFVNTQITADTLANGSQAHSVYKVQGGTYYAFDGTLDCDFDLVIEGPDNGWILHEANPPVFFQTPSSAGAARDMINLNQGGSVTLRNILLTGLHGNDVNISSFVRNFAGYKIVWDNCAFSDHRDHCTRSTGRTQEITITNCVFINGDRRGASPFGGMPFRLDAACTKLTFENNTVVNAARLLGNGGDFFTSNFTEVHNTVLNQQVNGHEIHWFQGLQANNIYYNWSWRGRNLRTNGYEAPFTTFETFGNVANKLDSISLYEGRNLFYLNPAFPAYWTNTINTMFTNDSDKVIQCYLWNVDVDSTILADDNFTIGKNYWQFDPMFTINPSTPSQVDSMLGWDLANWLPAVTHYPDWRVTPPVTWNSDGTPNLNWPPTWDLSYANTTLQKAGTDGLPLGDLNWWPSAKATYLANRDQYIAALRDSMTMATDVYIPGDPESAKITPTTSVDESHDSIIPSKFSLEQNYPNPFNPSTNIEFSLPTSTHVTLEVFNTIGQRVATLVNGKLASGSHSVTWNASNVPSGLYFYKLETKNFSQVRKMILMK
jgi:Secretion system C-terminal sorting domain